MPPAAPATAQPAPEQQRDLQHAWEQTDSAQMWSSVQEDEAGNLLTTSSARDAAALVRLRRHRLARLDGARSSRRLVRDMIRYVYLVVDGSHPMHERDPALPGGSTRFDVVLNMVSTFVQKYYDENPPSQLGLIVVRDGEAEMITRLTGSPAVHGAALVRLRKDAAKSVATNPHAAGGVFSLQNGLEVAGRSLGHMPRYGSREIVVIMGSLATCDPGDVSSDTLPRLKAANVRVSTVALQAEVHVCRRLADATGGTMGVCLDRGHLRDLLLGQAEEEEPEEDQRPRRRRRTCDMVRMGFPSHQTGDVPSLVHAGSSRGGVRPTPTGPSSSGPGTSVPAAGPRRPTCPPTAPCAGSSWCWPPTSQGASTISSRSRPLPRWPRRSRSTSTWWQKPRGRLAAMVVVAMLLAVVAIRNRRTWW